MGVHFLSTGESHEWSSVVQALEARASPDCVCLHQSLEDLLIALRTKNSGTPVVAEVKSDEELDQLVAAETKFRGHQLVLLLNDSEPDTLAKAHRVRPRVVFSRPMADEDLAEVIARMLVRQAQALSRWASRLNDGFSIDRIGGN